MKTLDQPVRYLAAKRALDVSLSLLGLLIGIPIYLVVGLLVKLTSPGPAFFKQIRVGVGGRQFVLYKFRSMYADAEQRLQGLMDRNEVSGPIFKIKADPRITPVGRFIRKFSLDELPQLLNVLQGEMSIVGPRPPLPREVACYSSREYGRLAVKPGLTCLWQVSGRSDLSFERWMELDLQYIETMSFKGDLELILRTIPAVLTARGAH